MTSICAVIGVRNEAKYLQVLLPLLAAQAIDVFILDNDSDDGSDCVYARHAGRPIVGVERLPYVGCFSLSRQLAAKREIFGRLRHDWVIHQDADEILDHAAPGLGLRDAIEEAIAGSFNAVNFEEFVFLPRPGTDYRGRDYHREILRYYYFAPRAARLHRAWRRDLGFDNTESGGHTLCGTGLAVAPKSHPLRHYLVLGEQHARQKYLQRTFSPEDRDRGWHGNRIELSAADLALPQGSTQLFELDRWDSKSLRRDRPSTTHYWDWSRSGGAATSPA